MAGPTLADVYKVMAAAPLKRTLRHGDVLRTKAGTVVVCPSVTGIPGFVNLRRATVREAQGGL